ncbi:MAG: hypothetical protein ACLP0J_07840 [Solirubrobacteraceae bacterium]
MVSAIAGASVRRALEGVGLEQAYADQPAVFVEALDHVAVDLEFAEDYGGKINPGGAWLVERHWLLARASQSLEHPQLLGFTERHLSRSWSLPCRPRSRPVGADRGRHCCRVPSCSLKRLRV